MRGAERHPLGLSEPDPMARDGRDGGGGVVCCLPRTGPSSRGLLALPAEQCAVDPVGDPRAGVRPARSADLPGRNEHSRRAAERCVGELPLHSGVRLRFEAHMRIRPWSTGVVTAGLSLPGY